MADKALDLLNAMGSCADEIASFLEGQGVKGYQRSAGACPIAEYLKACGYSDPIVDQDTIWLLGAEAFRTPDPASMFIYLFDYGQYPNLEKSIP